MKVGRRLTLSAGLILFIIGVGTAVFSAFGYNPVDALFQTVTTVMTVGFGEVHPFGAGQKIFTIFLIIFGVGTVAYAVSVLIEFFVEGYMRGAFRRRKMQQQISSMNGHVIICGWGRVGSAIARFLTANDSDLVVVDYSEEQMAKIGNAYVIGDATDESVLLEAGIERAKALITALHDDADNLYVTLTARSMRPDLFIVSRAAGASAVPKLRQAGADRVVHPQDLGGARMAALAVLPNVTEFLEVVMHDGSMEFRLEEVEVPEGSALAGQTLRSARVHDQSGTLVLAMREPNGTFRTNPPPTEEIVIGEVLIVIGDEQQVARLRKLAAAPDGD